MFVRDAVLVPGAGPGRAVLGGHLVDLAWAPGERIEVEGRSATAPLRAECRGLFSVPLGDVSRLVAAAGPAPDTALAWSPDGTRLAVGTFLGEVLVVDGWTGAVLARRTLAESLVRHVAWSADGTALYAGEQSPDAYVWALDPSTLAARWSIRLADHVGSSTPPPGEDLYGVYSLPAAYGITPLPGGDLLLTATHGWNPAPDDRRNQSRLLRLSPDGGIVAAWPADGAVDAVLKHPAVDGAGGLIAVPINRTATGPSPAGLPLGGVQVLTTDLEPVVGVVVEPLEPWYERAAVWKAVDVDRALQAIFLGFGDGRVELFGLDGTGRVSLNTGAPVLAGEVPIAANVGYGLFHGADLVFLTGTTVIPWGAASPSLRPPTAHPNEDTLFVVDAATGATRWSWSGSHRTEGLALGADGRHLVVGAGPRKTDERRDLYGALVFDLGGTERSGEARLRAVCPTEGPVFFVQAMTADGRVAVTEYPVLEADGGFTGAYRVTVLR